MLTSLTLTKPISFLPFHTLLSCLSSKKMRRRDESSNRLSRLAQRLLTPISNVEDSGSSDEDNDGLLGTLMGVFVRFFFFFFAIEIFRLMERRNKSLNTHKIQVPTLSTLFGVVIFLRLGEAVGNAGLGVTLALLTGGFVISFLTSLSLCAVRFSLSLSLYFP